MEEMPTARPAAGNAPGLHPALEVSPRARTEILGAILLALFLSALDQTIVGTALPTIVTDLAGNDYYTWVVTAYLLTSTITGPIYGKLSDLYGRKPMLLIGISLFLLGSLLSGLSQEMWQLILFRGVQGLGAGAIFPVSLAVIGDLFTPAERGKYQGLFGAVFGVSALIGPGSAASSPTSLSWHWVFFINLPIGAVALYVIWRVLPTFRRPEASRSIDYLGVAVFTAAVVPFLIGITNKQTGEWTDPDGRRAHALGIALGVVFVLIERRAIEPIVELGLFRMRTYSATIAATFFSSFGFFGAVIFLPRFFQFVRGSSPTESGYQILPLLAGVIISSIAVGPDRGADRARQGAHDRLAGVAARRAGAVDATPCRHRDLGPLALDVRRRNRPRAHPGRLHDHRPGCRTGHQAGRRHEQPDLLPADRRLHRAGHRRHDLR